MLFEKWAKFYNSQSWSISIDFSKSVDIIYFLCCGFNPFYRWNSLCRHSRRLACNSKPTIIKLFFFSLLCSLSFSSLNLFCTFSIFESLKPPFTILGGVIFQSFNFTYSESWKSLQGFYSGYFPDIFITKNKYFFVKSTTLSQLCCYKCYGNRFGPPIFFI